MKIFIDCEFDGHNGKLMSIAAVTLAGHEIYIICEDHEPTDPWVIENVLPHLTSHNCNCQNTHFVPEYEVGGLLRTWLMQFPSIEIIADSPVDVARFCASIATDSFGSYISNSTFKVMSFFVIDIRAYPTILPFAVQHNAWWDSRALAVAAHGKGYA